MGLIYYDLRGFKTEFLLKSLIVFRHAVGISLPSFPERCLRHDRTCLIIAPTANG